MMEAEEAGRAGQPRLLVGRIVSDEHVLLVLLLASSSTTGGRRGQRAECGVGSIELPAGCRFAFWLCCKSKRHEIRISHRKRTLCYVHCTALFVLLVLLASSLRYCSGQLACPEAVVGGSGGSIPWAGRVIDRSPATGYGATYGIGMLPHFFEHNDDKEHDETRPHRPVHRPQGRRPPQRDPRGRW